MCVETQVFGFKPDLVLNQSYELYYFLFISKNEIPLYFIFLLFLSKEHKTVF